MPLMWGSLCLWGRGGECAMQTAASAKAQSRAGILSYRYSRPPWCGTPGSGDGDSSRESCPQHGSRLILQSYILSCRLYLIFAVSIVHSLPTGASQNRAFKYKIISDSQSWVYWKLYRPQNVSYSTGEQYLREAALEARHCMVMRRCSLGGKGWAGGFWELWDFVMKQHISNGMDVRQDFIQVDIDNINYSTIYLRRCCLVVLIFRFFCSILF